MLQWITKSPLVWIILDFHKESYISTVWINNLSNPGNVIKTLLIMVHCIINFYYWIWAVRILEQTWNRKKLKQPVCKLWCDEAKWVWTQKNESQFTFSLYAPASEQYHTDISVKNKHTVPEIAILFLVMFKTIKYKGNWNLFLALSKNQYERILTHFAWSHHSWRLK